MVGYKRKRGYSTPKRKFRGKKYRKRIGPVVSRKKRRLVKRVVGKSDRKRLTIVRGSDVLPDSIFTTSKYVYSKDFIAGSGTPATATFSLNSVYDPDVTGTGTTAHGLDEAGALFQRYRVYKADVLVRLYNQTGTSSLGAVAVIKGYGESGDGETADAIGNDIAQNNWIEASYAQGAKTLHIPAGTASGKARYYKRSFNIARMMKMNKQTYDDRAATSALVSASPQNFAHLVIKGFPIDIADITGGSTCNVHMTVWIKYHVMFYNKKPLDTDTQV